MRSNPFIVRLIVVLMIAQQTVIATAARRDDNPTASLPRAGSLYADVLHHTRVLRVTDENDARLANVISTTSFNLDATRFVVSLDGVATLYRFDAATMNLLKEGPLTEGQGPANDSLAWSAVETDTLFGLDTADGAVRLVAYDAVSHRGRVVKDFSAQLGRGDAGDLTKSQANDDHFAFAFREAGQSAWRTIMVWDRAADSLYTFDLNDAGVANFTNVRFNESAEALVINGATTRVWRFANQLPGDALELAPDSSLSVSEQSALRDPFALAAKAPNSWPRERLSRDRSFALFGAGSGSRQDVYLAAVSPQAVASTLQWTNLVNSTAHDNSVQKTAGQNSSDDASATSLQSVTSGDAYVEFTAIDTDKERACGLSNTNAIHASASDINFAIKLNNARKAFVIENGEVKIKVKYKPHNVFRVAIESGVVNYYKNGELIYTSPSRPAYPLLVTASLVDVMSSVDNVMVSGAALAPVVSISPTSAALVAGQTQQFKAVITSAQIMGMSWSVDGGTITNQGLYTAPSTSGTYTVRATLAADIPVTATATVTVKGTGDTKPPAISAVTASGVTANTATVTWTTDKASDTQADYGASSAYGTTTALNSAMVTAHSVSLSGLVAGTTYHYRVRSRDAAGNLAISGDYTFTTQAGGGSGGGSSTAPIISVISTGSLTTSSANVTWTTDRACDTQVEYGTSASYGSGTALSSTQVTAHSATLTGLVAGTVYHFRVKSRDASNNSVTSGDQTFMTASTASGASSTGSSGTDPLKTDKNVYAEPAPPALPAAGGTLVDPTFGTTILRVTDERDGASNTNSYSYWPSLNRNSTRLFISVNNGNPTLYDFDPVNFRIANKRALFSTPLPGGGIPQSEDAIWSGTDPDVIYCHLGMKIYAYNVVSNSYTVVKDFTGQAPGANLWQMAKSIDDNAFGFTLKDANWNVIGCLAWQRSQNNLYTMQTPDVNEVEVDKSGQYLYVITNDQGATAIAGIVVNLQTRQAINLMDGSPDFAPGHKDCGNGTVVGHDHWNNALTGRSFASPHQFINVISFGNDWSQGDHVSLLGDGDGWLLVSMFVANTLPNSGLFKNELFLVSTDGTQRVRRLAHHHSVYRDYWDSPRADISRDGQFAIFTSNWGSTTRRDVFIVKIPPPPSGGSGTDTTPPVIGAVAGANVTATGATINWTTNEASDTQVDYGTTTAYGSTTPLNSSKVTAHSVSLSGLVANTMYHYRIRSRDAAGNLATSGDMVLTTPGAGSSSGGGGGSSGGGGTGGGGGTSGTPQSVVWTSVVNCVATGSTLQKTAGRDDTADAGARSQQSLTSGDGYLQFTATETNKMRFCGLARNPVVPDFTGIDFAVKLNEFGVAEVREANVYKSETPFVNGDVFRISIEGGVVKYYKNGTVFYTSTRAVSYPLTADASFIMLGGSFTNVVMAATTGTLAMAEAPLTATLAAMATSEGRAVARREVSFANRLVFAARRRRVAIPA